MTSSIRALFLFVSLALSGCVNETKQYVKITDFGESPPASGSCRIYVYREKAMRGTVPLFIRDSGTPIGDLYMGTYLVWERPAGSVEISVKSPFRPDPASVSQELAAGRTYHFVSKLVTTGYGLVGIPTTEIKEINSADALKLRSVLEPPIN